MIRLPKGLRSSHLSARLSYLRSISCYNQDQELDRVDFPSLNARLKQNFRAGKALGDLAGQSPEEGGLQSR